MKTVAIIGAGPSGLVTAKTLLRSPSCQYNITIFEKKTEIGGLWAVHQTRPYDGMLNPEMPTNLSRFNIGFSDLAWSSVGLQGHVPYWPKAWQVGQYLRAYTERYIPKDRILFDTRVTSATSAASNAWKLQWETTTSGHGASTTTTTTTTHEGVFDYLVVATGFYGTSTIPADLGAIEEDSGIKVAHSSKLRKLDDVVPEGSDVAGTILVVGGGMSGADASTVLASQLSDAMYSPSGDERRYGKLKLVQLCTEPAYALPLAAPCDKDEPAAPHFLPLDLCMYRLDKRPPGPIEMKVGQVPSDVIKTVHETFQGLVGDQSDLGVPGLTYKDDSSSSSSSSSSKAAYVTLTEQYSAFIRSGTIDVVMGRLQRLDLLPTSSKIPTSSGTRPPPLLQASYTHAAGETKTIDDVVGVVYATGFSPQPSLACLGSEIRKTLEHDAHHNRLPILLDEHATLHSQLPGLAVVGFHEGSFWGSMEMEARLLERKWSGTVQQNGSTTTTTTTTTTTEPKTIEHLKSLRKAMTDRESNVPQYWMGDYVGLMEQIARETGTPRNDLDFAERTGPISHARYADDTCDRTETDAVLAEYSRILAGSRTQALFAGRASFLALQGKWDMGRTIVSRLSTMPSGGLNGTAWFHPRRPTAPDFDFEYLYVENGTFTMDNGLSMNATRRYVYRYNEEDDKITVWFVKDDGKTVDYMYHGLAFDVDARKRGWLAKADHLCIADMYRSDYTFTFKGANLTTFGVTHEVKGPKKDYISETWYVR